MAVLIYSRYPWEYSLELLVHLVCSTNVPFLKCWTTTVPDERRQWQKGFWKVTLLYIIIFTISVIRAPQSLRHSQRIPLLQTLYWRRNLTRWQISVFLITVRKQKNKLSSKEGGKKVQLKERSAIDSKLTTCQHVKPGASQAFWV